MSNGLTKEYGAGFKITGVVLATLCIAVTYAFGLYLFASVEPSIRADVGFGQDATGLLTALGMAGFLVFSLLSGWLRDRFGANAMTSATLLICVVCLAWQATSTEIWSLAVQRFLLGACTATIWSPMVEIIPRFISKKFQGRILGLISSGTNFGLILNGGLTYLVLGYGTWRDLFLVTAGMAMLLLVAWIPVVRRTNRDEAERIEGRCETAATDRGMLRIPAAVRPVMLIAGVGAFVGMPSTTFLAGFSTEDLGQAERLATVAWTLMGAVGAASGAGLGAMSDYFGYRIAFATALGSLAIAAATFILAVPSAVSPLVIGVCLAVGFFPIYGLIPSFIAKSTPPDVATRTFGLVNVALGVAGMLGNAAAGFSRTMTGSHQAFFVMGVLVIGLGMIVVLRLREP